MIKKLLSIMSALVIGLCLFCGCQSNDPPKTVPKEGFYSIDEVYENGWITKEDLRDIAYYYHARYGLTYDEGYEPNPKTPAILDQDTIQKIKTRYLLDVVKMPEGDLDRIKISYYYGTYHGIAGVTLSTDYLNYDIVVEPEYEIGGVTFYQFWKGDIRFWANSNA